MSTNGHHLPDMLAALESAVAAAPLADLPALLGAVEKVKAIGWGRLLTGTPNGHATPTQWLTPQEVAKKLGAKPSLIYELGRQHKLKSYRLGKYRKFDEAEVEAFMKSQGG